MHRFIALVWQAGDQQHIHSAQTVAERIGALSPGWACVLRHEGGTVFQAGAVPGQSQAYKLQDSSGVVLGKLFQGRTEIQAVPDQLDEFASQQIVKSGTRHLIEQYWGRYVAFVHDRDSGKQYILRDPSGQFRCYTLSLGGIKIYFSRIRDIEELQIKELSTNWRWIAGFFAETEINIRETAFNEIQEVMPAECHKIQKGERVTVFPWNPARICRSDVLEDFNEAVTLLKRTTQACIGAWASIYDRILHNLSGGFDSAIVLSCLARTPAHPEVMAVNYYTATPDGDERDFARLSAEKAGCEFIELELPPVTQLDQILDEMPKTERPDLGIFGLPVHGLHQQLARERHADAFMTGGGGDHLFYRTSTPAIAADYAHIHGIDRRLFKIVLDTARLTRTSFWEVLNTAVLHGLFRRPFNVRKKIEDRCPSFLSEEARKALSSDYVLTPWLQDTEKLPSAKRKHIDTIIMALNGYDGLGRREVADVVQPLLSQPLIELCLRIPCYVLTRGGKHRSVARSAFYDDVPREILNRKTKGVTSRYFTRIYSDNYEYIREYILDGILANQSIIERAHFENLISVEVMDDEDNIFWVLQAIATEAWLRAWARDAQKAAA